MATCEVVGRRFSSVALPPSVSFGFCSDFETKIPGMLSYFNRDGHAPPARLPGEISGTKDKRLRFLSVECSIPFAT
jgi:hypothetical protein